ncbi:MAG: hypothetical protein ACRC42_01685, partial [Mycoplasma sp.]
MKKVNDDIKLDENIEEIKSIEEKTKDESNQEKKKEALWVCLILLIFASISIAAAGISGVFNTVQNTPSTPDVPTPTSKETTVTAKDNIKDQSIETIRTQLEIDPTENTVELTNLEVFFTIENKV